MSCSMACRTVSSVWVLVVMTETPPASSMTMAGFIMPAVPMAPLAQEIGALSPDGSEHIKAGFICRAR